MQSNIRVLGLGLLTSAILSAQMTSTGWKEPQPPLSGSSIPSSLDVATFIPPAPVPLKKVPPLLRKNAVIARPNQGHALTVIRADASTAPDLPKPSKLFSRQSPVHFTAEEIARIADYRRHELQLGATVYQHRVSLVHWSDRETGEVYEALCGFDVSLLEGIGEFIHDGESYRLMLMHSPARDSEPVPAVPPGTIVFLKGNPHDPAAMPIQRLQEVIVAEQRRLIPYQAARQRHQLAAAAWEKAHPAVTHDETFWLKPHRGSRYLARPVPELPSK